MKKLSVLGSTGSIGTQTLEVVRQNPNDFSVVALSCGRNIGLVFEQIKEFSPEIVAVSDERLASELRQRIKSELNFSKTEIVFGDDANSQVATYPSADIVVASMVGIAGLVPVIDAIKHGKDIALANKETLVAGGDIVMPLAKEMGVQILPVDSEHSAIWQCLRGQTEGSLDRILLTASGGPFRGFSKTDLEQVTLEKALNHPTWSMGGKITIDSASMMNKGLEIIEASHLFGVSVDKIDVVVHPQSVIHSMIRLKDGSVLAQMGKPSMMLPIMVALYYPNRGDRFLEEFDPFAAYASNLTFEKCDTSVFGLLDLAYHAGRVKGLLPCFMNSANEEAVAAFLNGKIGFTDIEKTITYCTEKFEKENNHKGVSLDSILATDKEARRRVVEFLKIDC